MMSLFGDLTKALSATVLATFGEPVVFHLEGQTAPVNGNGIFTAAYQAVDASSGVAVSTVQPVLEMVAANLPQAPTEGDAVTVQGVLYLIVDVRADGNGFLKLMLHKGASHETPENADP